MPHISTSRVTHENHSCQVCKWVIIHIWMGHRPSLTHLRVMTEDGDPSNDVSPSLDWSPERFVAYYPRTIQCADRTTRVYTRVKRRKTETRLYLPSLGDSIGRVSEFNMVQQHGATTWCNNMVQQHGATTWCNNMVQQHGATTWCNNIK